MSGKFARRAALGALLAVLFLTALGVFVAKATAQTADETGGEMDVGRGNTPPPGSGPDGEADPDGHSINSPGVGDPVPTGDSSPIAFFRRWIRELILFTLLFYPFASSLRSLR